MGTVQAIVGSSSLALLLLIAVLALFLLVRPNYVIPVVLAWASGGIYAELLNPKDDITDTFNQTTIDGIKYAAICICAVILFLTAIKFIMVMRKKKQSELERNLIE